MVKFLDALLGRTKEIQPNLDALFALPPAVITLQADVGLATSGQAAVCYKPAGGQYFASTQEELEELLQVAGEGGPKVRQESDTYGYHWVILDVPLMEDLVTRAHMVNATLESRGFGPQLLCSVFAFRGVPAEPGGQAGPESLGAGAPATGPSGAGPSAYLVYLYKRGTFYPFVPAGGERRDNEMELRIRGSVAEELPIEAELERWFPLWGVPIS